MSIVRKVIGGQRVIFSCPGCKSYHQLNVAPGSPHPRWSYNGKPDAPTFTPSILATCDWNDPPEREVCHSYVTDGRIQFLNDSTHELAGQTVPLPEWPHAPGTFGGIEDP